MATRVLNKILAGVMAGAVMSAGAPAMAQDDPPPGGRKDCLVEVVDDDGNTIGTDSVPEGTVIGLFHCEAGQWKFGWFPFDSYVSGTTQSIKVDEKGSVRDAALDFDAREGDLSVREMQSVFEKLFGEPAGDPGRAVGYMVTDREDELSSQELVELLDGRDVRGVKVLASTDLRSEDTINEVGERASGGEQGARTIAMQIGIRIVIVTIRCWIVGDYLICRITVTTITIRF